MLTLIEQQFLGQFQGIDQSLDSIRRAILTLCRQNIELLQLIAELRSKHYDVYLSRQNLELLQLLAELQQKQLELEQPGLPVLVSMIIAV